ncbi:543_t:CDS:2, partial [Funneliformis geosporum]
MIENEQQRANEITKCRHETDGIDKEARKRRFKKTTKRTENEKRTRITIKTRGRQQKVEQKGKEENASDIAKGSREKDKNNNKTVNGGKNRSERSIDKEGRDTIRQRSRRRKYATKVERRRHIQETEILKDKKGKTVKTANKEQDRKVTRAAKSEKENVKIGGNDKKIRKNRQRENSSDEVIDKDAPGKQSREKVESSEVNTKRDKTGTIGNTKLTRADKEAVSRKYQEQHRDIVIGTKRTSSNRKESPKRKIKRRKRKNR